MQTITSNIREQLLALSSEEVRESSQRFFKEEVRFHGVKSAGVRTVLKKALSATRGMDKKQIFKLSEALWQTGYFEEGSIACELAYSKRADFVEKDMAVFEKWLTKYVSNWAACDTLCNHSVGTLVEMYPELTSTLHKWARSKNRWKKRAAAVSLIIPARKGLFLRDVFTLADMLLTDEDDMVQKGYGWMLKAASEAHCQKVYDFVVDRRGDMPRTAFRYALEKMPPEMRKEAMKRV